VTLLTETIQRAVMQKGNLFSVNISTNENVMAKLVISVIQYTYCTFSCVYCVQQWFPNFFKRDQNLNLMNTSRPKPKTSTKMYFTCLGSENVSNYSIYYNVAKLSYYQP